MKNWLCNLIIAPTIQKSTQLETTFPSTTVHNSYYFADTVNEGFAMCIVHGWMCQTLLYSIYCIHSTWKEVVGQGDVVNRGVCCRSLLVLLGPTIKGPVKQIKLWIGFSCWSGQLDPHLIVKSVSIKKKLLSFIGIEPFKVQNNVF